MGRELKRVPLDFMWPMNAVWKGYINPYRSVKCKDCDGTGYSERAQQYNRDWYRLDSYNYVPNPYNPKHSYNLDAHHYHLTQIEVDALLKERRLDKDWFEGKEVTPESANEGEKLIIPMNMADGILLCRGKGNKDWNNSAPHGAGRLFSRTAAREQLSMDEFKQRMSAVYSTSVCPETLDESPMAYKPPEEIRSLIELTVEVLDVIKPVINLKAK